MASWTISVRVGVHAPDVTHATSFRTSIERYTYSFSLVLFLVIVIILETMISYDEPMIYAVHRTARGWEIIAPSDDLCAPAYWRVGVIRQHSLRAAAETTGKRLEISQIFCSDILALTRQRVFGGGTPRFQSSEPSLARRRDPVRAVIDSGMVTIPYRLPGWSAARPPSIAAHSPSGCGKSGVVQHVAWAKSQHSSRS
jgi:hypothetical protein